MDVEARLQKEYETRLKKGQSKGGKNSGASRRAKSASSQCDRIDAQESDTKPETNLSQASSRNRQARDEAAEIVGSSPSYIQDAKAVAKADPELFEKVKSGEVKLYQAKKAIKGSTTKPEPSVRPTVMPVAV